MIEIESKNFQSLQFIQNFVYTLDYFGLEEQNIKR
jgi:hypothetical protein